MTKFPYHLVGQEDGTAYLTIILPGRLPLTVPDDHPNYETILEEVRHGYTEREGDELSAAERLEELADISVGIARRILLSERVSVANGQVYMDGDEVDNSVASALVRALEEGVEDWQPLVSFMENIAANPEAHSREQLYDWLRCHRLTLTEDGDIIGYKGVHNAEEDGVYLSIHGGRAIVNGTPVNGQVRQAVGDTVEMPRSSVAHDPGAACSVGLHVGTSDYARSYASGGTLLTVAVNPRDVVSVPSDAGGAKVRVCRYTILAADEEACSAFIYGTEASDDEEVFNGDECAYCGEAATGFDLDGDPACDAHQD